MMFSGLPWVWCVLSTSLSDAPTLCCLFSHFVSLKLLCLSSGHEVFLPFPKKAAGFPSLKCLPFSPVHDVAVSGAITGLKQSRAV